MDAPILEAIPGSNPSGTNLRYEAIYAEIRARVRRARGEVVPDPDDSSFHGADVEWRFVIGACRDLLRRRSKDLMLAAWLTEGQLAVDGLGGLRDGLNILRRLTEKFWATLYPEMEDGDVEARLRVFEWVNTQLARAVRAAKGPESGLNWKDWAEAEKINEADDASLRAAHIRFLGAVELATVAAKVQRAQELDVCMDSLEALTAACGERFGERAPVFRELAGALRSAQDEVSRIIRRALPDDLPMVASDGPEGPRVSTKRDGPSVSPPSPASAASTPEPSSEEIEKDRRRAELIMHAHLLLDSSNYSAAMHLIESALLKAPESGELNRLRDLVRKQMEEATKLEDAAPLSASAPAPAVSSIGGREQQKVEFTLTAPTAVAGGVPFELFVWAHESQERTRVLARAREELNVRDLLARSKGPFQVASGTVLSVRLVIPGAVIDEAEDTMVWEEESTCVSFVVTLPEASQATKWTGWAQVYANGVRVARISFVLLAAGVAEVSGVRYRKAFASYASPDRDAVQGRIQGIHKVAPEVEVFLDVLSLRSGQNWEKELWRVIPASDIFYLFWSTHARKSEWVEKEWRCALRERGIEFIDPIPLESPQQSPPPPELISLHFNDWELAFRRGKVSA